MASKPILNTHNFWRLFHCLLSHSTTAEESSRTKAVWAWMGERYVTLKKVAGGLGGDGDSGEGLELLGIIWSLARTTNDPPGINIVRERAESMDGKDEAVRLLLDEYKEIAPALQIHPAKDMDAVLKDCCDDWEKAAVVNMLQVANRVAQSSAAIGRKKLSGPRDATKYLLQRIEQGLLINQDQILRPINVKEEAKDIADWYQESLQQKFLPTGLKYKNSNGEWTDVLLERTNFFGILGYLGDGKSTTARHVLYQIAAAGSNCLHVSLENPGVVERNKYILLHAHHPKFNGEFQQLTYTRFKRKLLTSVELDMLHEVGKDFNETVAGQLTIEQSGIASWDTIRMKIEEHNMIQPLDAVCVDYLQLLDPPNNSDADQRARMTSMIRDVRQFQMTFDGGRGLCLISPVQGNEEGRKTSDGSGRTLEQFRREQRQGTCPVNGLHRRCVQSRSGSRHTILRSCRSQRIETQGTVDTFFHMTGTGWILPGPPRAGEPYPNSDAIIHSITYDPDTIGDKIEVEERVIEVGD